jgi:hypothetical protein
MTMMTQIASQKRSVKSLKERPSSITTREMKERVSEKERTTMKTIMKMKKRERVKIMRMKMKMQMQKTNQVSQKKQRRLRLLTMRNRMIWRIQKTKKSQFVASERLTCLTMRWVKSSRGMCGMLVTRDQTDKLNKKSAEVEDDKSKPTMKTPTTVCLHPSLCLICARL